MNLYERMKSYENLKAKQRINPNHPVCLRLDGKRFGQFTQGLARPFDQRFTQLMQHTTKQLFKESQPDVAYTQSDEITLIWVDPQHLFFDGRIQKLLSLLTSMATAYFNAAKPEYLPEKAEVMALFDGRLWQVPDSKEALNVLRWREADARRNSVQVATRHYYTHQEAYKKSEPEMLKMLLAKGVNWNHYPATFKWGSYFKKQVFEHSFTAEERAKLPEKHHARQNPHLKIERSEIVQLACGSIEALTHPAELLFQSHTQGVHALP